jgi:hypothetical protein
MPKRIAVLAFRLLFVNVMTMLIALFVMVPLSSIWDFPAYQWFITAVFTFLMWLLVWVDSTGTGQKDVQKDKILKRKMAEENYVPAPGEGMHYTPWLGYAAGFAAQLPFFLVAIVACVASEPLRQILSTVLRVWNFMYLQLFMAFPGALPWMFLLLPLLFTAVAGLGYNNGPAQQTRMETIIERNKTRKSKRVQDDKKRAMMAKRPTRR